MKIQKEPLLLLLQIDPETGQFVEAAIHFDLTVEDHKSRHEIWWNKLTIPERAVAQKLVDSAIKGMLN